MVLYTWSPVVKNRGRMVLRKPSLIIEQDLVKNQRQASQPTLANSIDKDNYEFRKRFSERIYFYIYMCT